ncbi:hypothetical protein TSMEX_006272 [Taenia solium]|eukprot:TsM_001093200 transcript=TsM_001093200 gene=TsM_001093200
MERLGEEKRYFEGMGDDRRRAPQPSSGGSGQRKILASLQTIEATDPVTGESSIIPSVRTAHVLHRESWMCYLSSILPFLALLHLTNLNECLLIWLST